MQIYYLQNNNPSIFFLSTVLNPQKYITCNMNSPSLRSCATRTPIPSVLNIKNSIPGLSFSKYCPRSWLKKWTLISFCRFFSPFIFMPINSLTVLLEPSAPIRMEQWIFLFTNFPSLTNETSTVTPLESGWIEVHSCLIKILFSNSRFLLQSSKKLELHTWNPRFFSLLRSSLANLYCEKCATEIGLTTLSKSAWGDW